MSAVETGRARAASAGLYAEALRVRRSGRVILDVDAVAVESGRTLALLGPSGAGKSTLLNVLGLLEPPETGRVLVDGRAATVRDRDIRLTMAAVFQRPFLFRGTVGENTAYGLRLRGIPAGQRAERVAAVLELVGLGGWEGRSALTLSGGEAQRVALARALVLEPRVLLLDEPLSSLDPLLKDRLANEFRVILHERGVTAVYVTHDHDEARIVADDVAVMNEGRIVARGPVEDVFGLQSDAWTAAFLGHEPAFAGVVADSAEGIVRIACDGAEVLAVADAAVGARVVAGIRPEDVLLFEADADIPVTSARNRIDAQVASMSPAGPVLRVVLSCGGMRFAALVSRGAARDLALQDGSPVRAVFKATAVGVRPADAPDDRDER